jgi:hypothetical protein
MAVLVQFIGGKQVASMLADEAPDTTWVEAEEGVVVGQPCKVVDGVAVAKTEEEVAADMAAHEADVAAQSNRARRNRMLSDTDWMVIKAVEEGVEVDADLAAYRQALRDITEHTEWPHLDELDWPTL